jgi:hypothetical protein
LIGQSSRNPRNSERRDLSQSREIMRRQPRASIGILGFALALLIGLYPVGRTAAQEADRLRVQAEVAPGPYHVGQGFELLVGVIAKGKEPKIDLPEVKGARAWRIGTELRPISSTGIGRVVAQEYQYVVKFRVVAGRAGSLEIPAIQAQVGGRSGRSQPKRLLVKPVPVQGRPAEFLGGVGRFELSAEASPKTVRVGQELDFGIKVTGPAAWGMSGRPDLARYERPELGLRITAGPDQTSDEPPVRTFVYRLRPARAGDMVLPPVSIASFDPALARYVTHVTAGVPVRVVAVPSFDPTTIPDESLSAGTGWPSRIIWAVTAAIPVLLGAYLMLRHVRRRLERATAPYPELARRYAKRSVLESTSPEMISNTAVRIAERLSTYMKIGLGRPMGALTPDEAQEGVVRLTGSVELGDQAGRLTMRCDTILYGETTREAEDGRELLDDARRLFDALGRVKYSNRNGV